MPALRQGAALAACVILTMGACGASEQPDAAESPPDVSKSEANEVGTTSTTTTEVPIDPDCREAIDLTLGSITAAAEQAAGDTEAFATEDELGEVILDFLISIPADDGIDVETACGSAQRSSAELRRGLERTIRDEAEPVTDLTLALFAIGCSDELPVDPDQDPKEVEAFVGEVCPVIEGYFDRRGFNLESGPGEPGFR